MVSGPGQAPQMFGFDYQLTYTTGHRIAYLNFRRGAATLITPPTAQSLIEQVVPAAIAQTQALTLTRDLELNFLDQRYFTQSSDLPLSYAGGECIFFNISVTLINNRTAIHQITANSNGTCGDITIAQAPGPNSGFGTITQTPAPPTPAPTTVAPTTTLPTTTLPLTAVSFVETAISRMEGEMVTAQITKTGTSAITFDMVLITDDSTGSNADLVAPGGTPLADQPPPETNGERFDFTGLTLAADENSLDIPLTLALQVATEGEETLVFELQNASGEDAGNIVGIGTDNRLTITIADVTTTPDPLAMPIVIEFAQATYANTEGETTDVVIQRTAESGMAMVTIQSITLTQTGITTDDYTISFTGLGSSASATGSSISNIEIPRGRDSITLPITWISDADTDAQSMTLSLSSNNLTAERGAPVTAVGVTQTVISVAQLRTFRWSWSGGDYEAEGLFVARVVGGATTITGAEMISHTFWAAHTTNGGLYSIDLLRGTITNVDGSVRQSYRDNANQIFEFSNVFQYTIGDSSPSGINLGQIPSIGLNLFTGSNWFVYDGGGITLYFGSGTMTVTEGNASTVLPPIPVPPGTTTAAP